MTEKELKAILVGIAASESAMSMMNTMMDRGESINEHIIKKMMLSSQKLNDCTTTLALDELEKMGLDRQAVFDEAVAITEAQITRLAAVASGEKKGPMN